MTDDRQPQPQYHDNVEQERVQDNENWGDDKPLPGEEKREYWEGVKEHQDPNEQSR